MKTAKLLLSTLLWLPAYALLSVLWLLGWLVVPLLALLDRHLIVTDLVLSETGSGLVETWRWRIFELWGNREDGVTGPTVSRSTSTQRWIEKTRNWPRWRKIISWCAWRNPVGNLRWSWMGMKLDREEMEWVGNSENPHEEYKRDRERNARPPRKVGLWSHSTPFGWNSGVFLESDYFPMKRAYWCFARQGFRSGLWAIWPRKGRTHARVRLGWKCYPAYAREIDRYVTMTLQGSIKRKD